MSDMDTLERRITTALERIGQAIDAFDVAPSAPAPAPEPGPTAEAEAIIAALREDLQTERDANSQLAERLRAIKERDSTLVADLQEKNDRLTRQLDAQGLEVQRMRKNVIQLRETVRALREAQSETVDPHLLNKAMLVELEALRATRQSEIVEMDEILAELTPLIGDMLDA